MKIYEKPMAIVEKIEVEDVITASIANLSSDETAALKTAAGADNVIVFQW